MPHFVLFMKVAEFENVDSIHLLTDTNLCVSVRNPLSDYEVREKIVFNPQQTVEQDESERSSPCHFQLTWEGSKKPSTLTCLDEAECKTAFKKNKQKGASSLPRAVSGANDTDTWVPILIVSCRSLEPYAFHPMGEEFRIVSQGGTEFTGESADFSDDTDWTEYDEANDQAVTLSGIEFKWEAV
jgi:hypothetical protein